MVLTNQLQEIENRVNVLIMDRITPHTTCSDVIVVAERNGTEMERIEQSPGNLLPRSSPLQAILLREDCVYDRNFNRLRLRLLVAMILCALLGCLV